MDSEQFLKLMDSCWQSHCNQMASFKHCIHNDSETSLQFGRLELNSLRKNLTGRDCFVIFYFSIEVPLAKLDDGCIGYLLATGNQSLCNVIMETLNGLCKHDMNFWKEKVTRMHSSRMRTVRCSGRWGGVWGGVCLGGCMPRGGCLPRGGGDCLGVDVHLPLWTESQTGVKTLPFRNFVCGR